MFDLIVHNVQLYPMAVDAERATANSFAVKDGHIAQIGVPADGSVARKLINGHGAVALPGFIDCHTHACYAGNRMAEHALRLRGLSYAEISKRGGGILNTVKSLKKADIDSLIAENRPRTTHLLNEGVTTVEIKSGYGLTTDQEIKQLNAIAAMAKHQAPRIVSTYLALHARPQGVNLDDYIHGVIHETLPQVAKAQLAELVDVFVEKIAFTPRHMLQVFAAARDHGFRLRAHTDQLSNLGATRLAAEAGALSCDHLEYSSEEDVQALAKAGTVAVLLPGAFYFLRETQKPPVELLRQARVPIALGSDLNPGTSPINSLLAVMHLAAILFQLTPEEVLLGVTLHAAKALGKSHQIGSIEPGKLADFALWDIAGPEFLVYQMGGIRPRSVYIGGTLV